MGKVNMDDAARMRMGEHGAESRGVCWKCGKEPDHPGYE